MTEPTSSNPHDQYFRLSFSQPELAADLVAHYLPPEVVATLDLTALIREDGSFIDAELRAQQGDLLFRAPLVTGGESHIYLLFEHKSYPDRLVSLQLLRYCLRIWEQDRRERPRRRLRPIVPLVIYNGTKVWAAPRFGALFEGPEALRRYWPAFDFDLLDLAAQPEEAIVGEIRSRVALLALRAIRRPDLDRQLPRIAALLRGVVEQSTVPGLLRALLQYAAHSGQKLDERALRRTARAVLPDTGGDGVATLVEQWLERGRTEGIQKGIVQGIEQGIEKGLRMGLETGLHAGIRALIELKFRTEGLALMPAIEAIDDPERLEDLLHRIPQMEDLDELRRLLG